MLKKNVRREVIFALSVFLFIAVIFYGGCNYGRVTAKEGEKPCQPPQEILSLENCFNQVAEKVSPAVVNINTEKIIRNAFSPNEEFFRGTPFENFFSFNQPGPSEQKASSLGSGVIVSRDGYILTNTHVIKDADSINITLKDGTQYNNVKVIGIDESGDIAVLKVDVKKDLPYAVLGNSSELKVGSWVLAIGNPFGFTSTVTSGIVSATGRSMNMNTENRYGDFSDLIQTDASINPGNSGGPLVNLYGEVIGINTAIISPTGGSVGLGFAIPVNNAKSAMDDIIKNGSVVRGWLGVALQDITPELAGNFGVDKGVVITDLMPHSPAFKAGIQPGDVTVKINGEEVSKVSDFQKIVSHKKPGDTILLTIMRSKKIIDLTVIIEARPGTNKISSTQNQNNTQKVEKWKGLTVTGLTSDICKEYNISDEYGVIITDVEKNTRAFETGIRSGMVIKKINDYIIKDMNDYSQLVGQIGESETALLIKQGEYTGFVVI